MVLSRWEVYDLARRAGLAHDAALIATAIAEGESGRDSEQVGDESLAGEPTADGRHWGPSVGLWQVRSIVEDEGTGSERDESRLKDPEFNASAMYTISGGGLSWSAWTIWRNGTATRLLPAITAEVGNGKGGSAMQFVSRDDAGLRPARSRSALDVSTVTIHYGGDSPGAMDHDECAAMWRAWQAQHMDTDQLGPGGGADIAYNAGGCQHGYVFEGRGQGTRSAANGSYDSNGASYAVVYIGGASAPFTDAAKDALNDAADWMGASIQYGHRDWVGTECPGDEIYAWVQSGHPRANAGPSPVPIPTPQSPQEDDMAAYAIVVPPHEDVFVPTPPNEGAGGLPWGKVFISLGAVSDTPVRVMRVHGDPPQTEVLGNDPGGDYTVTTGRNVAWEMHSGDDGVIIQNKGTKNITALIEVGPAA
jgi:hypothetical protein